MISENNKMGRLEQSAKREQHFGIRKLTVGAASVLLGTTLWLGNNTQAVKADTAVDGESAQATEAKSDVSSQITNTQKVVVVQNQSEQDTDEAPDKNQESNNKQSVQLTKKTDQAALNEKAVQSEKSESVKDGAVSLKQEQTKPVVSSTNTEAAQEITKNEETPVSSNRQSTSTDMAAAAQVQVENGKVNTLITQSQTAAVQSNNLANIQKSAQAGKTENNSEQNLDLSKVAMQGVKTNKDQNITKDLTNVGLLNTKESIENTKQANQIDDESAKRIAQKYGISLIAAKDSVAASSEVQNQLKAFTIPKMSQAQLQAVLSKVDSVISNPNVQNMAKDLIRGNWLGVMKDGASVGQQLINNLGGIQGIIQSVTGKIAGSDWQKKLKEFNIPTLSQAQMEQVVNKLGQVISDKNVQNMAKDMIFGNWNGVLSNGAALGKKLVDSLGGIQGIIQKVTTDTAKQHQGTSLLDKLKNIVPSFVNGQKQAAQKLINNIATPAVKTIVSDVITGKVGKLLLDTIHYGVQAIKEAYTKAQEIIKQVKNTVQQQVAVIKTDLAGLFNKKAQTSSSATTPKKKSVWSFKLPKLSLPKFHFNLFGKKLAF